MAGMISPRPPACSISNKPLVSETPSIMDIAPTVLKFFGVQIPGSLDGKPLF